LGELRSIWRSALAPHEAAVFHDFVTTARGGHYTQTRAWAEVACAERSTACRYFLAWRDERVIGAALVLRRTLFGASSPSAAILRGPVCDTQDDLPDVLDRLHSHARAAGIIRMRVMPYWGRDARFSVEELLRAKGYHDVQRLDGPHTCSLRVDLKSLSPSDPFEGPGLAKVRREIRRAERSGVAVRPAAVKDIGAVRVLHEERMGREGHRLPDPHYYDALLQYFSCPTRGIILVSEYRGSIASVIFVARHGPFATFALGESAQKAVSFPKMTPSLAAAIAWAKGEGLATFDLGGIPVPSDTDPKRNSIADFKRSFSRDEIHLVRMHAGWCW